MNINMNVGVGGLFKFEVYKAKNDELVKETDWFHNLVLDQGLDLMATENWFYGCVLGTDGTAPDVGQTKLGNQVASARNRDGFSHGIYNKDGICYLWQRRRWRFKAGTFNNTTLAEVAITSSNTQKCWNRALITDANGKPTTITLLKDEYLDVTCEVRCYLNLEDVTGSFDVIDKNGNILKTIETITRPVCLNQNVSYYLDEKLSSWVCANNYPAILTEQKIGPVNSSFNSGFTYQSANYNTKKILPYVAGSQKSTTEIVFELDQGNKGKWITLFTSSQYYPSWQIGFSEAIQKTNTQVMTIRVTISWGRYDAA